MRLLLLFGARPCVWKGLSKCWWGRWMDGWMDEHTQPHDNGTADRIGLSHIFMGLHQGSSSWGRGVLFGTHSALDSPAEGLQVVMEASSSSGWPRSLPKMWSGERRPCSSSLLYQP